MGSSLYFLRVLTCGVFALAQTDIVTSSSNGAHLEVSATSLDLPLVTSSSNGAHLEVTATSLDLPDPTTLSTTSTTSTAETSGLADVTGVDSNITSWAWHWGWTGCSAGQKNAVLNGLSEAHTVLGADGVYYINAHWNDFATLEYLGSPFYAMQNSRRAAIESLFDKAYNYQQSWFSWHTTQVFCLADDVGICATESGFIAIDNNFKQSGVALGFCDRYFRLGTLQGIYNEVSKSQNVNDLSRYENRARPWISTITRIKWIAGLEPVTTVYRRPNVWQYVESASQAKFLANVPTTADFQERTLKNPSNYAWYAMAQWVQQKNKHYPQRPQIPDELQDTALTANLTSTTAN